MSFMRHTGALPRELGPQLPHHDISKGHRSHRHDGRFPLLSNAFLGPPKRFRSGRGHVMPQWPHGHGHGPAATEDWRQARHAAQEGYARDVVPSATRTTAHGARGARVLILKVFIKI